MVQGEDSQTQPEDAGSGPPAEQETDQQRQQPRPDEAFCSSCGEIIKQKAEICPECGVRQQANSSGGEIKNPGLAALASFFITGAGQIYNGQIVKGFGLMAIQVVNVFLMFILIGFLTFLLVWGYAIYDAYNTAEKINNGDITV